MEYEKGYILGIKLAKAEAMCPRPGETEFEKGRFDGWHDFIHEQNEIMLEAEQQEIDYLDWSKLQD